MGQKDKPDDLERILRYAKKSSQADAHDRPKRYTALENLLHFLKSTDDDRAAERKRLLCDNWREIFENVLKIFFESSRSRVNGVVFTEYSAEVLVNLMKIIHDFDESLVIPLLSWLAEQFESESLLDSRFRENFFVFIDIFLTSSPREHFVANMTIVVEPLVKSLEEAESLQVLLCILGPMISLSKSFESVFLERFEDVSDIIIGWLVEPTEDFDTYMELCQSMLDLERFWRQNMHQTVQYFDDFLKDIREFTGDAKKGFEEFEANSQEWDVFTTPLGNTLKQLEFRLRTYKCLMRAIGLETFTKNSYFDDAFLSRQLNVIVNISNEFLTKKRFCALEALTKSVVELTCMLVSGSTSGWQQKQIPASVLEFTRKLIDAVPESSCIIAITLVLVLIQEAPCGLPEEFATTFINELSHWKNIEHPDTVAELLGVYQSALGCSVSQVIQQSAYYCVLGELQLTLNELLRYHGATKRIEIHAIKKYINIAVAKVEDVHDFASEQKALHSALFLVTALTEFASTKVNVLSVHEIEPSFFVLVEKELRPAMVELNYPALEFALVTALRSHCECHGHFINNFLGNTRLMNKDALQSLKKYYPRLMKFVSFLLTKKNGAFSVRDLAISWAKDIIRCVNKTELGRPEGKRGLTYVNEFEELTEATVEAAWQADRGQLLAIHRCLEYAIGAAPESVAKHVIRGVFWLSSHADHEISDSYNKLLLNIPASAMNNFSEKDFDENSRNTVLYRAWIARRALMCRPQQFKNEQFSGVMDLLLNSKDDGLFEMLERGVWWSGRETKGNLAATNQHLNFWALWDAAAFCVENRLKTPLGSNIQTLNAIEKGIKGFERSLGMPTAKLPKKSDEHVKLLLTRPRLLIAYLGNLERLFFNAYEGCVSLPSASKSVRTFFINNKPICVKWLRGLRLSIMRVSLHCGLPADAWHHGQQLLSILVPAGKKVEIDSSNLERTLMMCAEAGIALKDESRLSGLFFWASRLDVEMNFIWLKGCALQSAGKFEPAISIYQKYLNAEAERRISNPDDDHVNTAEIFVRQQISESFLSISSWEKTQNWLESNSDYPQLGNLDYVKCMRSYDLDGIQGYDKQEVKGHCTDYLAKVPETTWRWPLMKQIADVQLVLAKVDRENKSLDMLEDVGRTMILAEGLQWPCQIKEDAIGILHGSSLARDAKGAQKNYQNFKIRAKLAECNKIPIICRLRHQSSASCLEEGRFERSRGNFNRASNLFNRAGLLVDKEIRGNRRSVDLDIIYKIERQECKRLASLGHYSEAIMRLGHKTSERLQRQAQQANGPHFSVIEDKEISKSLLNLVNWMEKDWEQVGPELEAMARGGDRNQLCNSLAFLVTAEQKITDRTLVKPSLLQEAQQEAVLGCFVNLASIKQPSYAKAHRALGSFCYKWGKRVIDGATKSGLVTLTPTENSIIEQSLRKVIWSSEEEFQSQFSQMRDLIGRTQLIEYPEDNSDNISILQQEEQVTVKLYNQFPWLYQYGSITATMLSIWRMVSDRLFELYSRAATAYFDALRVAEKDIDASLRLLRPGLYFFQTDNPSFFIKTLQRLLAKHSGGLKTVLENGLRNSSVSSWLEIVPQLFSRLHHPEPYVRNAITELLERIAQQKPDEVVFAVVVALTKADHRIEAGLRDFDANEHAQTLSSTTMSEQLARLAEEAKRLNSNASLTMDQKSKMMNELQQAQMKPVLTAFQHLAQITAAKPETPMEEKFQRRYGKLIQEALNRLQSNPAPMQPALSWAPFKQLHQELLARAGKRGQLVMKEISPKLAKLKDTYLPVPGRSGLTVTKFHGVLSILPTKTRPKKLHLRGGDGRTYTYLFKGLEDLHLDERIMQFLSVCNSLLPTGLSARNYSVTPLGSRSGLIGWVHGSNPFFVFYKKWQIRQQDKLNLSENVKVDPGVNPEKSSRREWPSSILREAHRELVKDTPNDLIEKELWCNSTCSADFLNTQTIFSKSLAVMSMLGYVIGLGDRHLDNILFDQETGEVVHIDYNICFEKGATLRVPERVPFRLTQNMEGALGVSGLQGPFKEACEETMKTLREGRDTLMTLLEAFVYDPLVDWTGAVDAGYAGAVYGGSAATNLPDKGEMDREIQRSLLATRLLEVRQPMIGIQEETNRHLAALIEKLEEYEIVNAKLSKEQETHKQIQTASRYLDQIPDDNLKTLGDRFKRFKIMQNKNHKLKELLHEKCVRLKHFQQASEQIGLNSAREIELLVDELLTPISNIPFAVNSAEVYMREIGQKQLSVQASELFNQLNTTLVRRHQITHRGVKMLAAYISVRALYPKSCIATHRINFWCDSFLKLKNEMSMESGSVIKKAHEKLLEAEDSSMNGIHKRLIKAKAHCLSLQIDEPREGLQAKLSEIHRRQAQQESVFADINIAKKAVEMATKELLADLPRVELTTLKCLVKVFTQNYLKSLTMEEHVATAGPKLASINSKSGDWFFEELKSLYFEQREIVTICARVFPTAVAPLNLQDIQLTSDVYTCLGKLYSEWRGYIVPEAVSLLQESFLNFLKRIFYSVLKNRQVDSTTEQYLETAAFLETTFT
ncbi:unnamed protein product, partial [Oikopleura dioica]